MCDKDEDNDKDDDVWRTPGTVSLRATAGNTRAATASCGPNVTRLRSLAREDVVAERVSVWPRAPNPYGFGYESVLNRVPFVS